MLARRTRIAPPGSFLPPNRVSNAALAERLAADGIETSDDWIVERTGIRFRHFAAETARDLQRPRRRGPRGAPAAADCDPQAIDLIPVATSTPDADLPRRRRAHGPAQARPAWLRRLRRAGGVPRFVYALSVADAINKTGSASKALVIGSGSVPRSILDFKDHATFVLFGDGAGAVVLEAGRAPGILASELHADGRHVDILPPPGTVSGGHVLGDPLLKMDGPAVFKLAVSVLESVARSVLAKAGRTDADIDKMIPHQANIRIMQSTARKLKLAPHKKNAPVDRHGNGQPPRFRSPSTTRCGPARSSAATP